MMRGSDLLARVDQSMFDLEQEFEDRKAELFSQPLSGHELAGRREYVRMLEVELDEMHEMRREIAQLYNLVGGAHGWDGLEIIPRRGIHLSRRWIGDLDRIKCDRNSDHQKNDVVSLPQ